MKLLSRYSRINTIAAITVFVLAGIVFYFALDYVFIKQIDDDLKIEEAEVRIYVKEHNSLPERIQVEDQYINYYTTEKQLDRHFSTISVIEHEEHDKEEFRQLVFTIPVKGKLIRVEINKSLEQTDDLIKSVLLVSLGTILAILLVFSIINRVVLRELWKPFYESLDKVGRFKVSKGKELELKSSSIMEFELMNTTMKRFATQAQVDYVALKTFSENAAHELQTPLAIISSKLDLLVQSEHMNDQQLQFIQSIYQSVQRLTRLNHALLLLAKIGNNQFEEKLPLRVDELLQEKIDEFSELWRSKHIAVSVSLEPVTFCMNKYLADILLNNLLSNATKYNYDQGDIHIELSDGVLMISNTSMSMELDKETLFRRFSKHKQNNDSSGLGLAIIKEIATVSGLSIQYNHDSSFHRFSLIKDEINNLL